MTSLVVNVKDVRNIGRGIEIGTCADCGSRVRQGRFDANFKHEMTTVVSRHTDGTVLHATTTFFDTCQN